MERALDAAAAYNTEQMGAAGGWSPGRAGKLHSSQVVSSHSFPTSPASTAPSESRETAYTSTLFSLADLESDGDYSGDAPPPRRVRSSAETRAKKAIGQALGELMKTPPLDIRNLRAQDDLVTAVTNAIEATRLLKVERRENRRATHDAETAEAALREVLAKIQNKHRLVPRVAPQTALACQETRRHERTTPRMRNRNATRPRPEARKSKAEPRLQVGVWRDDTADDLAATHAPEWTSH